MSVFAGLDVKLVSPPVDPIGEKPPNEGDIGENPLTSIFEGLDVAPLDPSASSGHAYPEQQEDSWGRFAARTGKSALAGVGGGVVDAATALYNIPAALSNATNELRKNDNFEIDPVSGGVIQRSRELAPSESGGERPDPSTPLRAGLPLIPSATDAIDKRIDQATGDYTRTPEQEKWFQEGIKFAASVASGGGLGSLAGKAGMTGAQAALKIVGSTKPSTIAGAGASGAAMQKAEEAGASAPVAFGSGLGATLATELAMKGSKLTNLKKAGVTLSGLGKKSLNVNALDSAEKLGIDLPATAVTKSTITAQANQLMSKMPYFGDKIREKIQTTSEQFQQAWEQMLDMVGAPKTEEVSSKIKKSYERVARTIPDGAVLDTTPILESIKSIREKVALAKVQSEPTKKLVKILDEFENAFAQGTIDIEAILEKNLSLKETFSMIDRPAIEAGIEAPVKGMLRQKQELNKIRKDKGLFDRADTDSLDFLNVLQKGVNQTLENYGATNPRFARALRIADQRFAETARRKELDNVLSGKIVNHATGEVSYNGLLKALSDPKQQKFLKNRFGEVHYKKLEDFKNVARAMESSKRNNPNPSGSGTMNAVYGLFTAIFYHHNPVTTVATVGGAALTTTLLTNKKFLNLATRFAKEPTEPLAKQLAAIVRENTGVTVQALLEGMRDNQE